MEWQIRPEPSREQRAAILAALASLRPPNALPRAYSSEWRRSGLDFDGAGYATASPRPRRSRGATRA